MCFASQRTHTGPTWNPWVFTICIAYVGPICDYHYGAPGGLPLMGHTGVCNNFPRGTHVFCLSKDPYGTHMKPMCVFHLYCPCWANVWLLLWGHTWAATNGAHWSMQQFSMWGPCVLPLEVPIWNPHKTHVCLPSSFAHVGPICDFFLWGQSELLLKGPCVLPLETPTSQVIKMVSPAGVQW